MNLLAVLGLFFVIVAFFLFIIVGSILPSPQDVKNETADYVIEQQKNLEKKIWDDCAKCVEEHGITDYYPGEPCNLTKRIAEVCPVCIAVDAGKCNN